MEPAWVGVDPPVQEDCLERQDPTEHMGHCRPRGSTGQGAGEVAVPRRREVYL